MGRGAAERGWPGSGAVGRAVERRSWAIQGEALPVVEKRIAQGEIGRASCRERVFLVV